MITNITQIMQIKFNEDSLRKFYSDYPKLKDWKYSYYEGVLGRYFEIIDDEIKTKGGCIYELDLEKQTITSFGDNKNSNPEKGIIKKLYKYKSKLLSK